MKKLKFTFIILIIIFYSCKDKKKPYIPKTHEVDATVTRFSCTDFYFYSINMSDATATEVDFGDGSPVLQITSNNIDHHQYTSIGNFNFKVKQTFGDGQVIEKKFPIAISQLCKFKRILTTNIPKVNFRNPIDVVTFEYGGNVYFQDDQYNFNVYNIASNRFFITSNCGNGISSLYDGTYLYNISKGGGMFNSIWKHTFDSIQGGGSGVYIPVNITERFQNLEIVANGKLYYGFGVLPYSIHDSKLYAVDCTTGASTIIPTPYGNDAWITVGGQAFYNNKIYIFASVANTQTGLSGHKVIIFDPVTNTFTSLTASIPEFMIGPGSSNKTKVINNYVFMRDSENEKVIVYDLNSNTFLNNCELSNMQGINFVANNKFYSLNPKYYNYVDLFPNSELWEYQP